MCTQELQTFVAKIGFENAASQNLFRKLRYQEQSRSQVFKEATFTLEVSEEVKAWLVSLSPPSVKYESYD